MNAATSPNPTRQRLKGNLSDCSPFVKSKRRSWPFQSFPSFISCHGAHHERPLSSHRPFARCTDRQYMLCSIRLPPPHHPSPPPPHASLQGPAHGHVPRRLDGRFRGCRRDAEILGHVRVAPSRQSPRGEGGGLRVLVGVVVEHAQPAVEFGGERS